MGRTKGLGSSKGIRNASPSSKKASEPPSVSALLTKAQSLMGEMDFDLARRFIVRILETEPNHFEAREMLGIVEIEDGNLGRARELFASLVPPSSTAAVPPPHSAYLYLAQLTESDPREALGHYQAAVDLLLVLIKGKERIEQPTDRDPVPGLKRTVISAIVAMVEIWMSSDLCYESEAEQTCDSLAMLAIQSDPENVEALECLASVRMSQSRPHEAKECLEKAWNILKDLEPEDLRMPSLSIRLSLTRRFLEISLFAQALVILQGILGSDDEEIDAWYLQGWCFFLMAEQVKQTGQEIDGLSWAELAQDARDCLGSCRTLYQQNEHDDEELISHVNELIKELEKAGIHPSPEGGDADEGSEGEDDWVDDDDEGDVEMG